MSHPLLSIGRAGLYGLAEALGSGRIAAPITRAALASHVPDDHLDAITAAIAEMERDGMAPRHIARAVRLLAEERAAGQRMSDRVQLVWSPPELDSVDARDTSVVVQELFRRARHSVLISTFALDEKRKAEALFGELAARMDAEPTLAVRVFANIHRPHHDGTPAAVLVRAFADRIRQDVWPGQRLPEVFYDPRSVEIDVAKRAVLHAKVVVVDRRWTLLTSANFTEAAQERNIEGGVEIDDVKLAERVVRQFDRFVEAGSYGYCRSSSISVRAWGECHVTVRDRREWGLPPVSAAACLTAKCLQAVAWSNAGFAHGLPCWAKPFGSGETRSRP